MQFIKKIKDKIGFGLFALFSQLLFLSEAHAQFTAPSSSDMSRQFINQIFGGLLDGGQDAFGASIGLFNGGILTVGGILVAYTILAGTLGTAHDGEMLGKKFSSVWVPIRTALGTALVLPVMSGGYCVMQAIVMWLIMQGVSLGNVVWNAYMSNPPALTPKIGTFAKESMTKFVEDVYLANVCVQANLKSMEEVKKGASIVVGSYVYKYEKNGDVYEFGDYGGMLTDKDRCGTVRIPNAPKIVGGNVSTNLSSINSLSSVFKAPDTTPVHTAHTQQITSIISATSSLAATAVMPGSSVAYSELQTLADNYIKAVEAAASGIMSSTNISKLTQDQGWFMAGTWATQIINQQNKINNAVKGIATVNFKAVEPNTWNAETLAAFAERGYAVVQTKRPEIKRYYESGNKNKENIKSEQKDSLDSSGELLNKITGWATKLDITSAKTDIRHPLIVLTDLGNQILDSIMIGIVAAAIASGIAGLSQGSGVAVVISIFAAMIGPLLVFQGIGGMLAYIIPNTPFFLWIGIIVGWTLMVVEAVIAAPLWAVMHLHPSGDDMTGRGGNGYMLVLGLVLRPALIIFGLITAIILSEILGKLINLIFFDLFLSNSSEGTLGFFGVLFGTGLYGGIMMLVVKNAFSMMHTLPDQLMRWIGGGSEQLGQYANQMSEGAMQKGAAAGGAAAGLLTEKALGSGSQALSGFKQMNQFKEDQKKQATQNKLTAENNQKNEERFQSQENRENSRDSMAQVGMMQGLDSRLGTGGGSIVNNASGGNLSSQQSLAIASQHEKFVNALGGPSSSGAEMFNQNVNAAISSGSSYSDAIKQHLPSSLDQSLGNGASSFLSSSSGGSFTGPGFTKGMENLSQLQAAYPNNPEKVSVALGAINNSINKGTSVGESFSNAITTIREKSQSADVSAIAPVPPKVED